MYCETKSKKKVKRLRIIKVDNGRGGVLNTFENQPFDVDEDDEKKAE
jgi:hypothetical protein